MNQDTVYLIAFISTVCYGINLLLDFKIERSLSTHFGYALISIITNWQIVPALAIGMIIISITYSLVIGVIWIESQIDKHHAETYKRRNTLL